MKYDLRGLTKKKKYVHVDKSEDPSLRSAGHRTIFQEMKKKPYHD
ncbi:hypothetical protein LCGC14_1727890 [marine sediment metagenome]|uniref:Uncharacterized protein n=1 Tax=marine sediment metagenome TaxID=412755 RepID=A0A0F9HAG3_9ZZZZ